VFTQSTGHTKTLGNFVKASSLHFLPSKRINQRRFSFVQTIADDFFPQATYNALKSTYSFLTPDLWPKTVIKPAPFQVTAVLVMTMVMMIMTRFIFCCTSTRLNVPHPDPGAHRFPGQGFQVKVSAAACGAA
jgi:hypothetical protein